MPQFSPDSVHGATITFSNPKSAGFDFDAVLCMGEEWEEKASASFHLNAGQSKPVTFSVTMPSAEGAYPVYISVSSGGKVVALYHATEDVVIGPVGITITNISFSPSNLTDAVHEYETSLGLGFWGDPFTIIFTVSNPFNTDVWARPDYALGLLSGESLKYVDDVLQGFNPAKLLYFRLLLNTAAIQGDYSYTTDWQHPWDPRGTNKGSNMVLGIYDPDGVPRLVGGADYWLKIPPGGSITTVKQAHLGRGISSLVPGVFDLCVVISQAYYLVYDPGYGQQRVGSQWVTVNWRPVSIEPSAIAVPGLVNITPA